MDCSEDVSSSSLLIRWADAVAITLLLAVAVWMLRLSFVLPITPDASIYLLHARTFTETLNRFALSHDSKGIMLVFLLALPVKLFGATMVAAATAQLGAYLVVAAAMIWLLRRSIGMAVALAALWLIAAFSPLMWGGRVRPEDFGMAFGMVALLAAVGGRRSGLAVCGAMAAMAFFTKGSLVLAPLGVGCVAWLLSCRSHKPVGRCLACDLGLWIGGAGVVALLVVGWIVWVDEPAAWIRQTFLWPAEYKRAVGKAGGTLTGIGNLFALLQAGRLQWLFVGGIAGICYGWRRGAPRVAALLATYVACECLRVILECEPWHYLVAGMVSPLLMGCALLGFTPEGRFRRRGVGVALLLLAPVLWGQLPDALQATRTRLLDPQKTPLEVLAERMAPGYGPGEQIMVNGADYQLLLLLHAPRPYPVLPLHLYAVSPEEYAMAAAHFAGQPPDWIIDSQPENSPVSFDCTGHPDRLAYVYKVSGESREALFALGGRYPFGGAAGSIPRQLLAGHPYRLAADTGLHQAWRYETDEETPTPIRAEEEQ
ncbi:MAG: hypothetical protein HN383_16985 [Verrucomicrobia bacterium]|jgi:hypothetical protein|nr:hypothetical protein [Verrucomicrobiota bacterium]MBT7702238.1 hypothetical protein [Verrucomicrobiota bacterium]